MTDILAQVHKQLVDGSVWVSREHMHNHDGLIEAIRAAGPDRKAYAAAVLACLGDPDVRVRTGAVAALREVIGELGADTIVAALKEPLLRGVKPAWRIEHDDLEQTAAVVVAAAVKPADKSAIAWLRTIAANRDWGHFALLGLARVDGDWLVANARGLVPHSYIGVLEALRPELRAKLIQALAPWPPEAPTFLTNAFWKRLPAAEATRLRALMWPGSAA